MLRQHQQGLAMIANHSTSQVGTSILQASPRALFQLLHLEPVCKHVWHLCCQLKGLLLFDHAVHQMHLQLNDANLSHCRDQEGDARPQAVLSVILSCDAVAGTTCRTLVFGHTGVHA